MMDYIFDLCVLLLEKIADGTGFTYKEINVWLFVIIHPFITLILAVLLFFCKKRSDELRKKLSV